MFYICRRCDKEFPCTYDDNLDEGSKKRPTLCPHDSPIAKAYGTAFERIDGADLSLGEILDIVVNDWEYRRKNSGLETGDSPELKQVRALRDAIKEDN